MRALLLVALLSPVTLPDGGDDQYAYVAGLAEKKLHDRVVKEAESFLRDHPRHPKSALARYRLACALFELEREPEALEHFRELAQKSGFELEAEVQFRLGQCELDAGRCEPAATALARVVRAKKDYLLVPATALLAEAHFRCERWAEAEAGWKDLLERAPQSEYSDDARCGLAWCAYRTKNHEAALERANRALERARGGPRPPREGEMRFLLGECQLDVGRPKEALAAYRAVGEGPFADAALRGAGFASAALGDHAGAAREFGQLLERYPDSRFAGECTLQGGIERLLAGDAAGARALLEAKTAPDGAETLYWRARAQSAAGANELALESLDRARAARTGAARDASSGSTAPQSPAQDLAERIEVARGDVLLALGRGAEAAAAWEKAGSDYALQAAAVASLNANRPADAVRFARKLLEKGRDPQYRVEAQLALGEGLFAQKDYPGAEQAFAAAYQEDRDAPRRARSLARIAWCRYLRGDSKGAAERFAALVREHPDAAEAEEAQFMEARAREALDDKPGAARGYGAYLERHEQGPHADEAVLRLVRLGSSSESDAGSEGLELLTEILRERPESRVADELRFELAERLSAAKRWSDARARYREILERHPESPLVPAARYGLAWCEYQQARPAEAMAALAPLLAAPSSKATEGRPELRPELRIGALELAVWCSCQTGDADRLNAAWRDFAAATRDEARLLRAARTAALALKKAGRAAEARSLLAALAESVREPEVVAAVAVERAYLLLEENKLDDAERELERAARAAPLAPAVLEAYFHAGEARFAAGEDSKASALYAVSARNAAAPLADRALYKDGFARLRSGDAAGSERSFATLVEKHPQSELVHESLFLLGEAQYRNQRYDEAIASLQRVLKEAPRHAVRPKALFRLGLALGHRERWAESLEALTTLAREAPKFDHLTEAELWRGRALAHGGDPRAARAALERVIANDRGDLSAQAYLELGRLHFAAREHDDALSAFLKVAVLYAEPGIVAEALYEAGRTLEAQGDRERAQAQYREILDQHAQTRAAAPARERIRALGGN